VLTAGHLRSNLLVKLGRVTSRTHVLPLVLFAPTARCNSKCVSCEWWRADGAGDLTLDEIRRLAAELPAYDTRVVVLTGGEPLLRPDVMDVADAFRAQGTSLDLLTSGLALERLAPGVAGRFREVTVSLDGHTPELYRAIRGVNGLDAVTRGVSELRKLAPHIKLRARSTLHRHNFRYMNDLVGRARAMGFEQISFLAADVTSDAFNHRPELRVAGGPTSPGLILDRDEVTEFADVVESTIAARGAELAAGQVSPGADGLRRLVAYYRAHLGLGPFPAVECQAPWTSVMIEADGAVRPCFFHPAVGNLRSRPLADLLQSALPTFRRTLDVATNAVCQRCVCTLQVGLRSRLW
jgi:Fe-coproporphyrin III synthase